MSITYYKKIFLSEQSLAQRYCLYTTGRALHKPKLIIIEQGGKGGGARGKCFFFLTKIQRFQNSKSENFFFVEEGGGGVIFFDKFWQGARNPKI